MYAKSDWEQVVEDSRENLWLVTTNTGKFVCIRLKGKFYIKDYNGKMPVKGDILYYEQL